MRTSNEKPTHTRWYILFMLSLMYLITYMDRVNISAADLYSPMD